MRSKLIYFLGKQLFKSVDFDESTEIITEVIPSNTIIFVVKGTVEISCDMHAKQVLKTNDMIFLPKQSITQTCYMQGSKVLFFVFDLIISPADKQLLQSYVDICENTPYRFQHLSMRKPLITFAESMLQALEMGFTSDFFFELKHLELFHFLVHSYKKEELALFFHPIISKNIDFKNLVLDSYTRDETLEGIVKLSCMSKSAFRKQFKEYFGVSAYQWILQQRCKKIRYLAEQPNATIKGIMSELNFDSPSHFNRFCRRHFNCTPKDLIIKHQIRRKNISFSIKEIRDID